MKISYNWLKQFIKLDWEAEKTGELLTDLGLEVEGISHYQSIKGGLEGVVVGHVVSCVKHENADTLKVTRVDLGNGEPVQIVCGAPNVAEGQKVPVATIGTQLYDAEGNSWKIKKGKIRGEESHGMICAEDELGLGSSHDGIMVLDRDIKAGTKASEIFDIENDQIFEIGLTPNRADAMSHLGTARDLKAGLQQRDIMLEFMTPSVSKFAVDNRTHKINVKVLNPELAPRYCGITISNLKVSTSPEWLQNRLKAIGISPKNNVVDATNYVLHELGQPLHAFDSAKIKGEKIKVKTVAKGTTFITLDGIERKLHEEDLLICDEEKPLCIAGVFGGLHSGVTEDTTSIFLESAYFDPVSIRKTAKRHGLNTDASFRFERGIDPDNTEYALKRAALLIQELAGGDITSDIVDIYPKKIEDFEVFLSFETAKNLIGEEIPQETIKSILSSLDIKINSYTESAIGLTIPSYRNDVQRECDVIEEILRVYGYNNISAKEKLNASVATIDPKADHRMQNIIGNQLAAQGFFEMLSNSLTTSKYASISTEFHEDNHVNIVNPLSNDLAVMRQSLLFSGLETIAYNTNRKKSNLKLFEFGKTYHLYENDRSEIKHLSIFMTGKQSVDHWKKSSDSTDFFQLKGTVNAILTRLGITGFKIAPGTNSNFNEGLIYMLGNDSLVSFGSVRHQISEYFGIAQEVLYADFDWDLILKNISNHKVKFKEISKFPKIQRDFALLIDKNIDFEAIYTIAKKTEKKLLADIDLFDVYEGKNLPQGKKSYAVRFTFQDENKTLTDKQVDKIMNKLQSNFERNLGAELR